MKALLGNKNGVKIKDKKMRQRAYKAYCDWIAKGWSSRSFRFQEGKIKCCGKTMESYIKDETEFPPIHREFADAAGFHEWEKVVSDSAKGINKDANTASLQMIMRNKYDWDKTEKSQDTHKQAVGDVAKWVRDESISETETSD